MATTKLARTNANRFNWTLLRAPVTANDTVIDDSSGEMGLSIGQMGSYSFAYAHVGMYSGIRIMCYGTDADNETGTMNLYGWMEDGPPSHIGSVLVTLGNTTACGSVASTGFHQHASTDSSIRDAFAAATTWLAADTYTSTDNEEALTDRNFTNKPGWLELDLSRSQYIYVAAIFADIAGGGVQCASMGAIYRPTVLRISGEELV